MRKLGRYWFVLSVLAILIIASGMRLYNLNWDGDQHLHPDERYLTMVVSAVRFPGEWDGEGAPEACGGLGSCLALYWDTGQSPLNPGNYQGFENYVYGTLPLFTTRGVARWVDTEACGSASTGVGRALNRFLTGSDAGCYNGFYTGYGGIHLVGRALSAIADLASMMGIIALAYVLYGKRTAALTGLLYAMAVLPIQHAHFFVVDSFATVFVVLTLLASVLSVRSNKLWLLLPAGLFTGLAVASKISVWPLALLVALAGFYRRGRRGGRYSLKVSLRSLVALALSGGLAAVAFRSAQPYAFQGPGFFGVSLNPSWLANMREIQQLMSGQRDVPFGHQWTSRMPIVFPWRNMVVWGMGIPLGLLAWVGWAVIGWRILAKRRFVHLLPWVWGTAFFLYQATQWVKSMRYLLPVYPVFALFAGWLGIRLIRWLGRDVQGAVFWRRVGRLAARAVPVLVIAGTALWSFAFLSIYRQPVTRIDASRWILENVPTAATLVTQDGARVNVPVTPNLQLAQDSQADILLRQTGDIEIVAVSLPKVDGLGVGGQRLFQAEIAGTSTDVTAADLGEFGTNVVTLRLLEPVVLHGSEQAGLTLRLVEGAPVQLQTSVLANEHWDDSLPLRVDGTDPFGNWYTDLNTSPTGLMNLYDDDTPGKRRELMNWLDEADYIILSSNRLYASIPRLPTRYPLTTEYYRQLFEGNLGYQLVAKFVSYPALGSCQFPDQEQPFDVMSPAFTTGRACSIRLPAAEEAFSVYDHPSVAIFAKTPAYSHAQVEVALPLSLLDSAQWVMPRDVGHGQARAQDDGASLLMSPRMQAAQAKGGTWSALFNLAAIWNRWQPAAVFLWALMVLLLGWITFPLLYYLLPNLRFRGYGLTRAFGLLLWSYLAWLLASLHILPFTRGILWVLVIILAGVSAAVAYRNRDALRLFVVDHWRSLLTIDALFVGLYLVWVFVRWLNPDLWHPVAGGEKPMDFAYLNAVIKSTWFPPYDPWFAGAKMNYYYYGFVMVGSLTKALGIVPSVAYNLAVPSLYALTGVGAYTLASNLAGGDTRRGHRAGIWGLLLVVVLGNLGEVQLLVNGLAQVGGVSFDSLIPGYPKFVSALVGLWKVLVQGTALPFRPEWWYWNASRLIPVAAGDVAPINEFPAFTFLYADLHAHMMSFPLTELALGIALQWGLGTQRPYTTSRLGTGGWWPRVVRWARAAVPYPIASLAVAALVGGALRATNTWDYPTYLALMGTSLLIGHAAVVFAGTRAKAPEVAAEEVLVDEAPVDKDGDDVRRLDVVPADSGVTDKGLPGEGVSYRSARTAPMHEGSNEAAVNQIRTSEGVQAPLAAPLAAPDVVFAAAPSSGSDESQAEETAPAFGRKSWLLALLASALLVGGAELLFRPFTANYAGVYAAFESWQGERTPLDSYLLIYGQFLLPIVAGGLAVLGGAIWRRRRSMVADDLLWPAVIVLTALVLLVVLVGYLHVAVAWLIVPLGVLAVYLVTARDIPIRNRLLWFWVGTALALSLLVEVAVLKGDIGRMNTVFKFYLQVWMLLGLSAAVFVERIIHGAAGLLGLAGWGRRAAHGEKATSAAPSESLGKQDARPKSDRSAPSWPVAVNDLVAIGVAILVFGAGLYPAFAIPAKARDRWASGAPHTLDGMTYMQYATQYEHGGEIQLSADYRVIKWMQEHVTGSPTIMEAQADREYLWGNRVTIYTGLPSVVGWRWHQVQQLMLLPSGTVEARQQDVRLFYNTTDPEQAREILAKYDVQYVILTPYERTYMAPEGAAKFSTMVDLGWIEVAYQDGISTIYRVAASAQ